MTEMRGVFIYQSNFQLMNIAIFYCFWGRHLMIRYLLCYSSCSALWLLPITAGKMFVLISNDVSTLT